MEAFQRLQTEYLFTFHIYSRKIVCKSWEVKREILRDSAGGETILEICEYRCRVTAKADKGFRGFSFSFEVYCHLASFRFFIYPLYCDSLCCCVCVCCSFVCWYLGSSARNTQIRTSVVVDILMDVILITVDQCHIWKLPVHLRHIKMRAIVTTSRQWAMSMEYETVRCGNFRFIEFGCMLLFMSITSGVLVSTIVWSSNT